MNENWKATYDQWKCAAPEGDDYDPAVPACDHDGLSSVNADGWCLVCGEEIVRVIAE